MNTILHKSTETNWKTEGSFEVTTHKVNIISVAD
jgi:hypothetical protein